MLHFETYKREYYQSRYQVVHLSLISRLEYRGEFYQLSRYDTNFECRSYGRIV